jgi:hypothetical protein
MVMLPVLVNYSWNNEMKNSHGIHHLALICL